MYRNITLLILGILLLGAGCWFFFRGRGDEAKIRKTLGELCRTASKMQGENAAAGALKLQRLDKMIAPRMKVQIRHSFVDGELTPQELASNIARYRPFFQWLSIEMQDLTISVEEDGKTATAFFTGSLRAENKSGSRIHEVRDLTAVLQKSDGNWLLAELSISDILEK